MAGRLVLALIAVCVAVWTAAAVVDAKTPPSLPIGPGATRPKVTVAGGVLVGLAQYGYRAFVGVPYAAAPVGALRFQSPTPPPQWDGERDAITMGNVCMQPSDEREYQAEDCLYLNVWAPSESYCASLPSGCPVWVHIHGGGWVGGAGSDGMYWGPFAANHSAASPVITVTMNYRLGALGFMPTRRSDGTWYGNYGFEDQRMALEWVHNNIAAFGGDPDSVTLSGQSAGGISVLTHLTSPRSFNLFHQVIVQSGPPATRYNSVEQGSSFTQKLAEQVGCPNALLECLVSKTAEEILAAQEKVHGNPFAETPLLAYDIAPWMIHIDGNNVYDSPMAMLRRGVFSPSVRSVVVGSTANETAGWVEGFPIGAATYSIVLDKLFADNATAVKQQYPLVGSLPSKKNSYVLGRLADDYAFTCANRALLRVLATTPTSPDRPKAPALASYLFTHKPSSYPRNVGTVSHCKCDGCSCHGAELTFIKNSAAWANATFTSDESALAANMIGLWTAYVWDSAGPSSFPPYSVASDNTLSIGLASSQQVSNYHASYCDFWDSLHVYDVPT